MQSRANKLSKGVINLWNLSYQSHLQFASTLRNSSYLPTLYISWILWKMWYSYYRSIHILKFIYSEKATKFCEIFTILLTSPTFDWHYNRTKVRWRFRKILWPSHNIWTLYKGECKIGIIWEGHRNLVHLPFMIWRY